MKKAVVLLVLMVACIGLSCKEDERREDTSQLYETLNENATDKDDTTTGGDKGDN